MHVGTYPRVGVTAPRAKSLSGCDDECAQAHRRVGYDYLTRQVAALDATEKGHTGLASYYTERGEPLGCGSGRGWTGSTDLPLAIR